MADTLRITAGLGDSETRRLLGAHDWQSSPLGPPDSWPPELATAVSMALSSTFPMFVALGPEQVFLYNDAYIPVLGDKHPSAFGALFQRVWWEIWDDLAPIAERVGREADIPVSSAWGIGTPELADHAVQSGQLDLVMVGRGHLADPHWPYQAARKLKIERPSWTLPAPYAHWLERYAV